MANGILAHYGMNISDWHGTSFLLATATGKSELLDSLGHLWAVAEQLSARRCDPLDSTLLARLAAARD